MANKIGTQQFIGAANRYAAQHLKAKNTNGDAYITKAEAEKLPADLRDNYNTIQRNDSNRQVTVKEFKQGWTSKVQTAVQQADVNHDGWLTRDENKRLPNELRDNLANYMNKVESNGITNRADLQTHTADAIKKAIKNPEKFLQLCDPANVQAQLSMGMGTPQYVAEAIGLGTEEALRGRSHAQVLRDIKAVNFDKRQPAADRDGNFVLKGTVTLADGSKLPIQVPVATLNKHLLISPAYG